MLPTTREPARGLQAPRAVHTLLVRACHPQHLGGVFLQQVFSMGLWKSAVLTEHPYQRISHLLFMRLALFR